MDMNIRCENIEKQQQLVILEEDEDGMSVPNWLFDVLKWITNIEMANSSLSFSCKLFKQLCWPKLHGNVEPHIVPYLEFRYEPNNSGNICRKLKNCEWQMIPIAAIQSPEYIHGFGRIIIRFLDNRVLEFFKNIALEDLSMETSLQKWQENEEQSMLMRNLFTILSYNFSELKISNYRDANHLLNFNQQFPTFIDQMPMLDVAYISDLDFGILFNWLMKSLTNGRQKILRINCSQICNQQIKMEHRFIIRIKQEFLHSTERKNFLIILAHRFGFEQFNLHNKQTGEMLNLYRKVTPENGTRSLLARCPKGDEHWKEGSEEKIWGKRNTNILLDIDGIMKK